MRHLWRRLALVLILLACPRQPALAATTWAIVVGVGGYDDSAIPFTPNAHSDALAVRSWLYRAGSGPRHVVLLTDGGVDHLSFQSLDPDTALPTRENIRTALFTWLAPRVRPDDTVYFYFAGQATTADGRKWLLPDGARLTALENSAVDAAWVAKTLRGLRCRVFCWYDTSFRGRGQAFGSAPDGVKLDDLALGPQGICWIAAGLDGVAAEMPRLPHGAFTQNLLLSMLFGDDSAAATWQRLNRLLPASTARPAWPGMQTAERPRLERVPPQDAPLGWASRLALSPDGKTLAVSWWTTVTLWDVATRSIVTRFEWREQASAMAFSADGRTLAVGASDGAILLWDVPARDVRALLVRDPAVSLMSVSDANPIDSLAFSLDGTLLAAGRSDGHVDLWDLPSSTVRSRFSACASDVDAVAFSADGRRVATGSEDGTVTMWDLATARRAWMRPGHTKPVKALAFSSDGRTLASGGDGAKLWSVDSGKVRMALDAGSDVRNVAFSLDGRTLVAAADETVRWDVASGRRLSSPIKTHQPLALSRDARTVASASSPPPPTDEWRPPPGDLAVEVREVDGLLQTTLRGRFTWPQLLAFSADGRALTAKSDDGLALWDLQSGSIRTTSLDTPIAWQADRLLDAERGPDGTVRIRDLWSGATIAALPGAKEPADFSSDGKLFAAAGGRGIRLWDVASGRLMSTFTDVSDKIESVVFSGDGRLLAYTDWMSIFVVDVASGKTQTVACEGWLGDVEGFSADNRFLLTSIASNHGALIDLAERSGKNAQDGVYRAFLPQGRDVVAWRNDDIAVRSLASSSERPLLRFADGLSPLWGSISVPLAASFSHDGRAMAAMYGEPTRCKIALIDMTGRRPPVFVRGFDRAQAVALTPDGGVLAVANGEFVDFFSARSGAPLATAVQLAGGREWAVVTPDGLYDGTPAALQAMRIQVDGRLSNMDKLPPASRRPGLLAAILKRGTSDAK